MAINPLLTFSTNFLGLHSPLSMSKHRNDASGIAWKWYSASWMVPLCPIYVDDIAECGWVLAECGWDLAKWGWDLAEWFRASGCYCQRRNSPGFNPSTHRRHKWNLKQMKQILNKVYKKPFNLSRALTPIADLSASVHCTARKIVTFFNTQFCVIND